MPNITNIPPQRVPFIDERTGLISREWYRFLLNLFQITGSGTSDTSVVDLQIGPPPINDVLGELGITYDQAQLASMMAQYEQSARDVINQIETAPAIPQFGTIAAYNLDGTPIAGGVSYGTGSALAVTPVGTTGQILTSAAAAAPTWTTLSSVSVTSFSAGTTGLTPAAATTGAVTLAGTLAVANGGTGVTTSTGTGSVVLSTSPTLVTPTLGAASATSVAYNLGAAATPSVTFTGDLNTGVFSPTADTVAISTGGTERLRVSSAGNVGIATTNPIYPLSIGDVTAPTGLPALNVFVSTDAAAGHLITVRKCSSSAAGNSPNISQLRARGTAAAPLVVQSGDAIGAQTFYGYDGATYRFVSVINAYVDGVPGLSDMPGRLVFFTTPDGSATTVERVRIDNQGNFGIGTAANLSRLSVAGPIALQSPSTVNAATYTVAITDSSLRFTTTNNTLTLPAAASFPGRILYLNTITANSVTSAISDVIPLGSNTAGTAILAATAGKFSMLQSDGTNWITMMSN